MFERYTEKARRVIFFLTLRSQSNSEASISNRNFCSSAMFREDHHVITRWLGGGDWHTIIRQEIEQRVYRRGKGLHVRRLAAVG